MNQIKLIAPTKFFNSINNKMNKDKKNLIIKSLQN